MDDQAFAGRVQIQLQELMLTELCSFPLFSLQTGGEIGVGMCESWKMTGVNWLLFIRTFWGWIGALVTGAIISALLFSIGEWFSFHFRGAASCLGDLKCSLMPVQCLLLYHKIERIWVLMNHPDS